MLGVDEEMFGQMHIAGMVERCRSCGYASRYERRDYYFTAP